MTCGNTEPWHDPTDCEDCLALATATNAIADRDVWKMLEVITGQMVRLSARVDELEREAAR